MSTRYDWEVLNQLWKILGCSLDEITEKGKLNGVDVDRATWFNWLTGKTAPRADQLPGVCATLGIHIMRVYSKP